MYDDLSERQLDILNYIKQIIKLKGYPPAVREIGDAVGLSSSSTVHNHLNQLEKKGYIKRDRTKPRAIEVLNKDGTIEKEMVSIPILGKVTAGTPIFAYENIEDTFPLPFDFIRYDNVFILNVQGDSMINAGIYDGDMVIVRKQNTAINGEIIVALIEDEATVKRFYKENDCIRLQPENESYEPIIVNNVSILGKVIALIRKF